MDNDKCISFFIRAPVKGHVKTRLAEHLNETEVLNLYTRFVSDMMYKIKSSGLNYKIFYYPKGSEALIKDWLGTDNDYVLQKGNDLELNVFQSDKDYLSYPENWLTLKNQIASEKTIESNLAFENSIKVYPTITSHNVNIDLTNSNEGRFEMYNTLGELVIQKDLNNSYNSIDVSQLAQGTYILKVYDPTNSTTEKITIQ